MLNLANALTVLRLCLAPVLLAIAWFGHKELFLALLVLAFATDALDGFIARWFNQKTALGPKLDTWADGAIYAMLPVAVCWLWPAVVIREWVSVTIIISSGLLPLAVGLIKFRMLTSYHTWSIKLAVLVTVPSAILMLLGGPAWPFRVSALVCLAAAAEAVAITLTLSKPRTDVGSLWHVLKKQQ